MTSTTLPVTDMRGIDQPDVDTVDVSLVIPVMDEQENIAILHDQVREAISALGLQCEVIYVDDGSRDQTLSRLRDVFTTDPCVQVVNLRRNFGKTPALLAGFAQARGSVVVTLDGDLQDDPAELSRFLVALNEGYDVVSGWKRERHDPLTKTVPSKLFNAVVRRFTGIPLHDFNCGFKAYKREVLDELKLYGELHRFIPVLAHQRGYRVGEIVVQHRPRKFGRSKFGAGRLFKGLLDFVNVLFLTRYMQRPLQLFGPLGLLLLSLGSIGFAYLFVLKLLGQDIFALHGHGPLLFFSGILIVSGIQLFVLGLLGEMLRHYGFRSADEYSVREHLTHVEVR